MRGLAEPAERLVLAHPSGGAGGTAQELVLMHARGTTPRALTAARYWHRCACPRPGGAGRGEHGPRHTRAGIGACTEAGVCAVGPRPHRYRESLRGCVA